MWSRRVQGRLGLVIVAIGLLFLVFPTSDGDLNCGSFLVEGEDASASACDDDVNTNARVGAVGLIVGIGLVALGRQEPRDRD